MLTKQDCRINLKYGQSLIDDGMNFYWLLLTEKSGRGMLL